MYFKTMVCLIFLSFNLHAEELLAWDFDLNDFSNEKCNSITASNDAVEKLSRTIKDPKFWNALVGLDPNDKHRLKNTIIVIPVEKELLEKPVMKTMGMTAKESLLASGDDLHVNGCSEGHDQGTMNNRFCHSAIARTFSAWLESMGVSKVASSFAGGVFWVPKEYFIDLNPSAHDIAFTYTDRLGTKRTTFEFTIFGDALFKHYMGKDFAPFKSSTPFITITRKL